MNNKKILVVDDSEAIQLITKVALEKAGYSVMTAFNGKEALDTMKTTKPCLIILDLMMPVMDGWVFMEELRKAEENLKIPVVVISAFSGDMEPPKSINESFAKPVNLKTLKSIANKYCEDCIRN
ncbi:MAG: response regulator [Pseudobdellovibrionaceae bacterium]